MKLYDLKMQCGNCPIIDYCNDYTATPPCSQPRFENLDTEIFLKLAETSRKGSKNLILDDVARRMRGL